jgi:hypothetical protein
VLDRAEEKMRVMAIKDQELHPVHLKEAKHHSTNAFPRSAFTITSMCGLLMLFIDVFIFFRSEMDLQTLNISTIQQFIDMGRLTPQPNRMLSMRDLLECGLVSRVKEGVKLLAKVCNFVTSRSLS